MQVHHQEHDAEMMQQHIDQMQPQKIHWALLQNRRNKILPNQRHQSRHGQDAGEMEIRCIQKVLAQSESPGYSTHGTHGKQGDQAEEGAPT